MNFLVLKRYLSLKTNIVCGAENTYMALDNALIECKILLSLEMVIIDKKTNCFVVKWLKWGGKYEGKR